MSWNDSWRRRRHHPAVRLCAHSHEWIVRWLESLGWTKSRLIVPTRQQVLSGDPDPGFQEMRYADSPLSIPALCSVPGARTPKARLSVHEWKDFIENPDTGLARAYRMLGMDIPPARNRLRRT